MPLGCRRGSESGQLAGEIRDNAVRGELVRMPTEAISLTAEMQGVKSN